MTLSMPPHFRNGVRFSGMKIGLLGGSFNPAHEGHLAMSLHALKRLGLDQIWWLVSPQNPLKNKETMMLIALRTATAICLATPHPRLIVTTLETQLGTHYTIDTLRALKRRFPRTSFVWLMGADNLRQMPRWKSWAEIFDLVPVAVFRRPAYPAGHGLGKVALRFGHAWHTPGAARRLSQKPLLPAWVILDNKLNTTSATNIRKDPLSWQT